MFTAFTLSQVGMVRHWWTERGIRWTLKAAINGLGTVATTLVVLVIGVTKFMHGAWMVIVLIPLIVLILRRIRGHYDQVAAQLSLVGARRPRIGKNPVVVLVGGLHKGVVEALEYARENGFAGIQIAVESPHLSFEAISNEESDRIRSFVEEQQALLSIHLESLVFGERAASSDVLTERRNTR